MKRYCINKATDNDDNNEVHVSNCFWLSLASRTEYLGEFLDAIDAVFYAKRNGYPSADGCKICSSEAHTA